MKERVSRKIKKRDGEIRIQSRIPDFGLVRRTNYIRKLEGGVAVIKKKLHSRLVATVEIKPAAAGTSAYKVRGALEERYFDLCAQIDIFFAGNSDITEIVGIFAAGTYWNLEVFTRNSGDTSTEEDEGNEQSYKPSGERHSSSEARDESVESCSGKSFESSESSPDELDIIDKPEDLGRQPGTRSGSCQRKQRRNYRCGRSIHPSDRGRELGLTLLMEAIENLEGCEQFDGPL